jgi:general secretion pathway protein J
MKQSDGYTLIEVLIALAVFAMLAVITSSAMYQAFTTRSRVNAHANRMNALQLALIVVERDIKQANMRAIRGNEMRIFSPFVGQQTYLEFTRGGLLNPNAMEVRSSLKRVALTCSGNKLIRRSWATLDTPNRQKFSDQVLLENVGCTFAYLTLAREVLPEWHETVSNSEEEQAELLPIAIQLNLNIQDWGKMSILFVIPGALYGG